MSTTRSQRRPVAPAVSLEPYGGALLRHGATLAATALLLLGFWASRPEWSPEMRLWKAVGDAAVVLLLVSLAIGPLARLWRPAGRLVPWRRQVGIWAAVVALTHSLLVIDGWARWSVRRFLGFEFIPQLGREARLEPGFGLANLVGLVALIWLLVLLATSSDRALRSLGPAAWKWLHQGSYVVSTWCCCTLRTSSSCITRSPSTSLPRRRTGSAGRWCSWGWAWCRCSGLRSGRPCDAGVSDPSRRDAVLADVSVSAARRRPPQRRRPRRGSPRPPAWGSAPARGLPAAPPR